MVLLQTPAKCHSNILYCPYSGHSSHYNQRIKQSFLFSRHSHSITPNNVTHFVFSSVLFLPTWFQITINYYPGKGLIKCHMEQSARETISNSLFNNTSVINYINVADKKKLLSITMETNSVLHRSLN